MNTIFGPVQSRRLGLSLGVDIVPMKTCSLSCVFCQVGKTPQTTITRREYISAQVILDELEEHLKTSAKPDWITFSGSGEPTLNSAIGEIIRSIKAMTDIPVCVITNGTMLHDSEVRQDIAQADAVMPSLHSAVDETYRKICNLHPGLDLETIIDGLADFRMMYHGNIWLEILFVKGMNDSPVEIDALNTAILRINPDSIQLNTVVRPPAESVAIPVSREKLEEIRSIFGPKAEIIAPHTNSSRSREIVSADDVRKYLLRRPGNIEDISKALGAEIVEIEQIIESLSHAGEIRKHEFSGKLYWEYVK